MDALDSADSVGALDLRDNLSLPKKTISLFFDMNMSPKIPELLREIGYDAVSAKTVFPPDTNDDILIEYAGQNDLVIVTHDIRMRKAHEKAYEDFGARVIFLTSGIGAKNLAEQIHWYRTTWGMALRKIEALPEWMMVRIASDGDVRVIQ